MTVKTRRREFLKAFCIALAAPFIYRAAANAKNPMKVSALVTVQ